MMIAVNMVEADMVQATVEAMVAVMAETMADMVETMATMVIMEGIVVAWVDMATD